MGSILSGGPSKTSRFSFSASRLAAPAGLHERYARVLAVADSTPGRAPNKNRVSRSFRLTHNMICIFIIQILTAAGKDYPAFKWITAVPSPCRQRTWTEHQIAKLASASPVEPTELVLHKQYLVNRFEYATGRIIRCTIRQTLPLCRPEWRGRTTNALIRFAITPAVLTINISTSRRTLALHNYGPSRATGESNIINGFTA